MTAAARCRAVMCCPLSALGQYMAMNIKVPKNHTSLNRRWRKIKTHVGYRPTGTQID